MSKTAVKAHAFASQEPAADAIRARLLKLDLVEDPSLPEAHVWMISQITDLGRVLSWFGARYGHAPARFRIDHNILLWLGPTS